MAKKATPRKPKARPPPRRCDFDEMAYMEALMKRADTKRNPR